MQKLRRPAVQGYHSPIARKNLTTNQYYQLAKQVKEITDAYQVPLIIDDRLDVCLAVDAAGLHIGDDELPVSVARQVLGPEKILSVTAKTVKELWKRRNQVQITWGQEPFFRQPPRKMHPSP